MPSRIEDYAVLSDTRSAALVARDGSIDWLAFPRFDSPACFAALLGDDGNGRWQIAPAVPVQRVERRYRGDSLVLETLFHTADGTVALVDCMPLGNESDNAGNGSVIRLVEGRSGRVPMQMDLRMRFDYGSIVPWVRRSPGGITAVAGPDGLRLATPAPLRGQDQTTRSTFTVAAGAQMPFSLTWFRAGEPAPHPLDAPTAIAETESWWQQWSAQCTYDGDYADDVRASLTVLKGLSYSRTGGLMAAATTSLPEAIGGPRNWDYRYCWLRDATFSLMSLLGAGFTSEAAAWRDWLLRAVAGNADQLQIMYGARGERRLSELELPWLAGYEGSAPVRVGNAAHGQFQLDVYGEVLDALHQARCHGLTGDGAEWSLQQQLVDFVADHWSDADDGLWEVRGGRQDFTHSKVMAWVAVDRAIASVEQFGFDGPLDRWRQLRDDIHADVLANGVDDRGAFVQRYGSTELDASLLMVPLVGFLPPDDPRVAATVAAIEQELCEEGFVRRYRTEATDDGLTGGEGVFLMCTFWLADNYALLGRHDEAVALHERLLGLRNDVGLLSEQYDPAAGRMLGNFPQAFSHVALVNTAANLTASRGRREGRADADACSPAHKRRTRSAG